MVLILKRIALSAAALALLLVIASCSTSPTGQSNDVVVRASLKQLGVGTSVARVVLDVSSESGYEETLESTLEDGLVTFRVEDIPIGEPINFVMSAFNAQNVLLYSGEQTESFSPGDDATIDILLLPQVPLARVTPVYSRINGASGSSTINVIVSNVDDIFGASFRIEFNPNIVQIGDVEEGSLFDGSETLFLSRVESNYVAVAITLQGSGSAQGIDGGGVIASIELLPGSSLGASALTINPETLRLVDWQGNTLPTSGSLYIDNGEVEVIAQ